MFGRVLDPPWLFNIVQGHVHNCFLDPLVKY